MPELTKAELQERVEELEGEVKRLTENYNAAAELVETASKERDEAAADADKWRREAERASSAALKSKSSDHDVELALLVASVVGLCVAPPQDDRRWKTGIDTLVNRAFELRTAVQSEYVRRAGQEPKSPK